MVRTWSIDRLRLELAKLYDHDYKHLVLLATKMASSLPRDDDEGG